MNILNFRIGKPKFNFHTENGIFYAENNSRKTFFSLFLFGIMSLFIFSGFFMLSEKGKFNLGLILTGFIVHPIFGFFALRKFLWLIRGKEMITIDSENLRITKSGSFWIKDKIFENNEVRNIRDKFEDEIYSKDRSKSFNENMNAIRENRRTMLCFTIGEILFDYKFSKIRVFNNLNENERKILIDEIKKHLENNKTATNSR